MEFNNIIRGAKRAANDEESIFQILDAGFLCHIAFQHEGQTMMIPTAYGRSGEYLYFHGSTKNFMFSQILNGQDICVGVTHLDGIVAAKTLFHMSVNYRSAVIFGKAALVEDDEERMAGLRIITDNVLKGRWDEVPVGSPNELKATMVLRFKIEKASAKVRDVGPQGDEADAEVPAWSGHIPLALKALEPVQDMKFGETHELSESVRAFWEKNR